MTGCQLQNVKYFPQPRQGNSQRAVGVEVRLQQRLADVVAGISTGWVLSLASAPCFTPLSATLQIMHKFFNLWRIAHASEDLRNIEDTKIAAFLQLWSDVSRGGVVLFQPF